MVGLAMMYAKTVKSWHTSFLIFIFIISATISNGDALQRRHVSRSSSGIRNNDGIFRRIVKRNENQDSANTGAVNIEGNQGQRMIPEAIAARGLVFYTIQGNFTAVAYPSPSEQNFGGAPNLGSIEFKYAKQNQESPSDHHVEQGSPPGNHVQQRSPSENYAYAKQGLPLEPYLKHGSPPGIDGQQRSQPVPSVEQGPPPGNYVQQRSEPIPLVKQEEFPCLVCHYAQAVAELLADIEYFSHNKDLPKDFIQNHSQKMSRTNLILRNPVLYRQYFDLVSKLGKFTFNGFDQRLNKQASEANIDYSDPFLYKQLSNLIHDGSSFNDIGQRFYEETNNQDLYFRNPLLYRHNSYLDICRLEAVPGPCKATFSRFYYNPVSRQCENFVYGGCQGNANNFLLKEECESFCMGAKRNFTKL